MPHFDVGRGFAGAVLLLVAAPAAAEHRSAQVAGWEIDHIPTADLREMGSTLEGPSMHRRAGDTRIEYRVVGGLAREIQIQRLNCGEATDANGGAAYSERIYFVGSEAELAEAAREMLRQLDANYDSDCPARPAELAEALSGLEPALAQAERWAAEDPLPPIEAWQRSPGEVRRVEPPATITWSSLYEAPAVSLALDQCGNDFYSEVAPVDPSGDPAARGAGAREALARLLRQAEARCALHPTQAARLLVGFDEAVAEAEAQLAPAED